MPTNDPGLDPTRLAGLAGRRLPIHDLDDTRRQIRSHLDTHDGYVSYSGGKDSLVSLDLTLHVDPTIPVVFFDSGLEFPETHEHLADVEDHYGIAIDRIPAEPDLLEVLRLNGTWDHHSTNNTHYDLHAVLIDRPSAAAHAAHGPGVIWGVRAAESPARRAAYGKSTPANGTITRANGTTAYGPIWNWSTAQVWHYIHTSELPANPIYPKLARLGAPEDAQRVSHVIDGLRIAHGRITWLARGWPTIYHQLVQVLPRIREFV